jgi:hypothetical protein
MSFQVFFPPFHNSSSIDSWVFHILINYIKNILSHKIQSLNDQHKNKQGKARIPMYMLYLKCLINHIFFISSHLFHEFSNSSNLSFNFISKFLNSNELIKNDLHPTLTLFV